MTSLRPIAPIDTTGLEIAPAPTGPGFSFEVDPRELLVDESYQRDLSPKSMALIQRITANWDWRKFKPPIVSYADTSGALCLEVIDGQHTAIAAASRPDIDKIPVFVVEAPERQARALAFIGHNRDRVTVTAMQLHRAAAAAGDDDATTVEQVCERAGVKLINGAWGGRSWAPGESVAIGAISALVARRGAMRARQMLQILALAEIGPIRPHHIRAVEFIFTDGLYASEVDTLDAGGAESLASAIRALGEAAEQEAKNYVVGHRGVPMWKAIALQWFKKMKKRRKAA